MIVGNGLYQYDWIDSWAQIPPAEDGRTHGVVVTRDDNVLVLCQATPGLLCFNSQGDLVSAWGDFPGGHGLTLVTEQGQEFLWITDAITGQVIKTTLQGDSVQTLSAPDLPIYATKKFQPTWVAVNSDNGDIWVTDGYGSHYVHRYDSSGHYLSSINGTEGTAGHFDCPHGIWIDRRKVDPELYIADRSHCRIQVYDLEGNFKRVFGTDFFTSPCSFATDQEAMYIPELIPRITILDKADRPICYVAESDGGFHLEGWPNNRALIKHGEFNSPHGIAIDSTGSLYIVEWIVGGRITKLQKRTPPNL